MQPDETLQNQNVTISRAEYDNLISNASAQTQFNPNPTLETAQTGVSRSDTVWFVLAVFVLVSFLFPAAWILFLPILVFALTIGRKMLKISPATRSNPAAKGVLFVFKIIVVIGAGVAIFYAGMILLFIIIIGLGGGHIG